MDQTCSYCKLPGALQKCKNKCGIAVYCNQQKCIDEHWISGHRKACGIAAAAALMIEGKRDRDDSQQITIITQTDGESTVVGMDFINQSETLKDILEDSGDNAIPLPAPHTAVALKEVIDYVKIASQLLSGDGAAAVRKPLELVAATFLLMDYLRITTMVNQEASLIHAFGSRIAILLSHNIKKEYDPKRGFSEEEWTDVMEIDTKIGRALLPYPTVSNVEFVAIIDGITKNQTDRFIIEPLSSEPTHRFKYWLTVRKVSSYFWNQITPRLHAELLQYAVENHNINITEPELITEILVRAYRLRGREYTREEAEREFAMEGLFPPDTVFPMPGGFLMSWVFRYNYSIQNVIALRQLRDVLEKNGFQLDNDYRNVIRRSNRIRPDMADQALLFFSEKKEALIAAKNLNGLRDLLIPKELVRTVIEMYGEK